MSSAARQAWYTYAQAVAWIAFRSHSAVEDATQCDDIERPGQHNERGAVNSYAALFALTIKRALRASTELPLGKTPVFAIVEAEKLLKSALGEKKLRRRYGLFSSTDLKKLFPAETGRGKGPGSRDGFTQVAHNHRARFGLYMLTNPAPAKSAQTVLRQWCLDQGLAFNPRDFLKRQADAIAWAKRELLLRKYAGVGVVDAKKPASRSEMGMYIENLKSWQRAAAKARKAKARKTPY